MFPYITFFFVRVLQKKNPSVWNLLHCWYDPSIHNISRNIRLRQIQIMEYVAGTLLRCLILFVSRFGAGVHGGNVPEYLRLDAGQLNRT